MSDEEKVRARVVGYVKTTKDKDSPLLGIAYEGRYNPELRFTTEKEGTWYEGVSINYKSKEGEKITRPLDKWPAAFKTKIGFAFVEETDEDETDDAF